MKILHVNRFVYAGGAEQYLHWVSSQLIEQGHQCAVLCGQQDGDALIPVYHVPEVTEIRCVDRAHKLIQVREVLDRFRPDVVLVHSVLSSALAQLLVQRAPVVRFVHDVQPVCPEGRKTLRVHTESNGPELCPYPLGWSCQARGWMHRCMPRNPRVGMPLIHELKAILMSLQTRALWACPSKFLKDQLVSNGVAQRRVTVVPHCTTLTSSEMCQGLEACDPEVLFVGRVNSGKGLDVLLQAMVHLPVQTHLTVVGDGPDLESVKKLANNLKLSERVSFSGWVPAQELDKYYARARVVVVPSVCPEGFCMVGIEAMAHARPVVGTTVGGIGEWLEHGVTGFAVTPGDYMELAQRVNQLLQDADLAGRLGRQGRLRVEQRFVPEVHLDALMQVLERAVSGDNGVGE